MDICVSREVYLVQISSSFGAVKSLIEKKKSFFRYAGYLGSLNSVWSIFEEFALAWLVPGPALATCTPCTLGFPQKLLSE